jgi:hypothetical protein
MSAKAALTMSDPPIENHQKLSALFGAWPSWHDAEIVDLHYWRGDIKPGDWDDSNIFPILTLKVIILGEQINDPDILVTIRFHDVNDFKMEGFNHVNKIIDFTVTVEERGFFKNGQKLPPYLAVSFSHGFGMSASFRCFRIEVLDACPYQG